MTMKIGVFIFTVGLLAYIRSAPTTLETVWLNDVTTKFQTDERTLSDLDLPNELTFHLSRGSEILTLNLKRNHDINPTADVYFARKLKDGQSVLVKTRNLEKKDVAYYQDRKNGAFMTVKCVKNSNELCGRVIICSASRYLAQRKAFAYLESPKKMPANYHCVERLADRQYGLALYAVRGSVLS